VQRRDPRPLRGGEPGCYDLVTFLQPDTTMSTRNTTDLRIAMRHALGVAVAPCVETFAIVGGHADSGFGLVVVDQGNPRRVRGIANASFAVPI